MFVNFIAKNEGLLYSFKNIILEFFDILPIFGSYLLLSQTEEDEIIIPITLGRGLIKVLKSV